MKTGNIRKLTKVNIHNLGTANVLLNIIADYYAPRWCQNPNQEMNFVLGQRRSPVILSCTSRGMNHLQSTLTRLTNAVTPIYFLSIMELGIEVA